MKTENYPEGVYVNWRDGFWVGVNYSSRPAEINLPAGTEIILGHKLLKPADVLVWK
ncbi:MAG TPA: Beta-galactosidase C-terminal domain [Blastocatellia bacterium]|nr:Beta-galactosidase C-terminal domain [Blastocatellia bacterium]